MLEILILTGTGILVYWLLTMAVLRCVGVELPMASLRFLHLLWTAIALLIIALILVLKLGTKLSS